MIKFKRFRIENAIHYLSVTIPLEKQGLNLVTGANGVGKSSLFNLFQSCLYGGYALAGGAKAKKNDLVGSKGKDFLLEIELEKDGETYVRPILYGFC